MRQPRTQFKRMADEHFVDTAHRRLSAACGVALAALLVLLNCRKITNNPDLAWHVAIGERWLRAHQWMQTDPYTYTAQGHPYIDLHWLFQVGAAAVNRMAGPPGLIVAHAVLIFFAWILLAWTSGFLRNAHAAGWWTLLALLLMQEFRFLVRPEVVTFAMIAMFLAVLWFVSPARPRWLWALIPLQVVWTNCQGLFLLGPGIVGLTWVGEMIQRAWEGRRTRNSAPRIRAWGRRRGARLLVVAVALILATLLNPYGLRGTTFPLQLVNRVVGTGTSFRETIGEFQPPLQATTGHMLDRSILLGGIALSAATFWARGRRRGRWRTGLCYLAFLWMALSAYRNVALFAVVAVAVVMDNLRHTRAQAGRSGSFAGRRRLRKTLAVAFLGVCVALAWSVATNRYYLALDRRDRFGFEWNPLTIPGAGVMTTLRDLPRDVRLFNTMDLGGYLIAELQLEGRIFIDGRLEVVRENLYREYAQASTSLESFEAAARRWGFQAAALSVLSQHGAELAGILAQSRDWTVIDASLTSMVFVSRPLLERASLKPLQPSEYIERLHREGFDPGAWEATTEKGSRILAPAPDAAVPFQAGLVAYCLGWDPLAESLFREVLEATPRNAVARANLARMLVRRGDLDAARMEAEEALRLDPQNYRLNELVAKLLVAAGSNEEIREQLQEMERRFGDQRRCWEFLAEIYQTIGDDRRADECRARAREAHE